MERIELPHHFRNWYSCCPEPRHSPYSYLIYALTCLTTIMHWADNHSPQSESELFRRTDVTRAESDSCGVIQVAHSIRRVRTNSAQVMKAFRLVTRYYPVTGRRLRSYGVSCMRSHAPSLASCIGSATSRTLGQRAFIPRLILPPDQARWLKPLPCAVS